MQCVHVTGIQHVIVNCLYCWRSAFFCLDHVSQKYRTKRQCFAGIMFEMFAVDLLYVRRWPCSPYIVWGSLGHISSNFMTADYIYNTTTPPKWNSSASAVLPQPRCMRTTDYSESRNLALALCIPPCWGGAAYANEFYL